MEANNNRAEAERWVTIAEKLLTARDLVGSKTFAIRARESDPKLEPAEQILAVADTLIAGETRINNQHDWYSILQLVRQTPDVEIIATQYRRLALLLHPQRNKLPFADQAIRLVQDAWSVLSNPSKKALYDNELSLHAKLNSAGSTQKPQPVRKSPRSGKDNRPTEEQNPPGFQEYPNSEESSRENFWTACPYCYNIYEYPRVYEECTLRCQNCRRAFHAITIPTPPVAESGNDAYFCCWGYVPLGFSPDEYGKAKDKLGSGNWSPFSPMFTCPSQTQNVAEANRGVMGGNAANVKGPKKANVNARSGTKPKAIIIDEDDVLMEVSDPSEDSDDDWGSNNNRKKKKAKNVKGKTPVGKNVRRAAQLEKIKKGNQNVMEQVFGTVGDDFQAGSGMQEDLGVENATMGEISKKASGSSSKKQTGKHGNELGKLDLNVEFSNEVEEPAPGLNEGHRTGNGEEDNIEGIGFFEGLDEFLSSLPILSVVGGDDKGKAA